VLEIDAGARLSRLVTRVNGHGQPEHVCVTVHGESNAVLLATEDLESPEGTTEILADADAMRRLHASEAELARGDVESCDELDAAMARRRRRRRRPTTGRTVSGAIPPPPVASSPTACPRPLRRPPTNSSSARCWTTPTASANGSARRSMTGTAPAAAPSGSLTASTTTSAPSPSSTSPTAATPTEPAADHGPGGSGSGVPHIHVCRIPLSSQGWGRDPLERRTIRPSPSGRDRAVSGHCPDSLPSPGRPEH
jgi:PHD/YefM family antitoxin component YafN of YafNO toxin-antitoxin module